MSYAITPATPAGARAVAAAVELIEPFRARAEAADRDNAICPENYADMQRSGVASAFVPEELGGIGMRSIHDWTLIIATLARGDGSAAIAISMHLSATRGLAALYRNNEPGSAPHERAASILKSVSKGETLICSTTTERGTDNLHPLTEAVETEGGWRLNGCHLYVTLEPCAMCAGASFWAQLDKVVYAVEDPNRGFRKFNKSILHPKTTLISGVMEAECKMLLDEFFVKLRN